MALKNSGRRLSADDEKHVWECSVTGVSKNFDFFLFKINFFIILNRFDTLISKIIFKK
jgi:hypothetical protein